MAGTIRIIKGAFKAITGLTTGEITLLVDGTKDLAIGGALAVTGSVIGDALEGTAVGEFIDKITNLDS